MNPPVPRLTPFFPFPFPWTSRLFPSPGQEQDVISLLSHLEFKSKFQAQPRETHVIIYLLLPPKSNPNRPSFHVELISTAITASTRELLEKLSFRIDAVFYVIIHSRLYAAETWVRPLFSKGFRFALILTQ